MVSRSLGKQNNLGKKATMRDYDRDCTKGRKYALLRCVKVFAVGPELELLLLFCLISMYVFLQFNPSKYSFIQFCVCDNI